MPISRAVAGGKMIDRAGRPPARARRFGHDEAADDAQERGLAAAGGAEQRHQLPTGHVERDPLQRHRVAVAVRDAVDGQGGAGCGDGRRGDGGGGVGHW